MGEEHDECGKKPNQDPNKVFPFEFCKILYPEIAKDVGEHGSDELELLIEDKPIKITKLGLMAKELRLETPLNFYNMSYDKDSFTLALNAAVPKYQAKLKAAEELKAKVSNMTAAGATPEQKKINAAERAETIQYFKKFATKAAVVVLGTAALCYGATLGWKDSISKVSELENIVYSTIENKIKPLEAKKADAEKNRNLAKDQYDNAPELVEQRKELAAIAIENAATQESYQTAFNDLTKIKSDYLTVEAQLKTLDSEVQELYILIDSESANNKTLAEKLSEASTQKIEIENKIAAIQKEYDAKLQTMNAAGFKDVALKIDSYQKTITSLKLINANLQKITEKMEDHSYEK